MPNHHTEDVLALRVTPLVFAAVSALGAWADPVEPFGVLPGLVGRISFALACAASLLSATWPEEGTRFVALACGSWAAITRGVTILVAGQPNLPRKPEIIGGSIWMACSYLILFCWLVTVPLVEERSRARR